MKYIIWIPIIGLLAGNFYEEQGKFKGRETLLLWSSLYQALCLFIVIVIAMLLR